MARDPKYDILFEPIQIGPKTMKNRFYQTPHCNGAGSDMPGTQAAFRAMKAEGGWGAVCTEACSIDPEADSTPNTLARLWDDGDIINLRHLRDSLHEWGALAGVELWHSGGETASLETRVPNRGPCQKATHWGLGHHSHEADEDDIQDLERMYVEAAKRAVQAGFDIVYVYGSYSVLPAQFLSKFHNRRTDRYGGSIENRARFWIESLEKLKRAVGDSCAVTCRISVDQLLGPADTEAGEDGVKFVEIAEREGVVDLWDINICGFMEWGEDPGSSRFYKANHQAPFTRQVKGAAKAPVINVGRFTSPDDMIGVINSGQCDIIGAARPSIADPFLPRKIEEGRPEDIRECIGCNICISRWERGAPLVCTQNACANEEYRRGWHPEKFDKSKEPCSVLVVGAGPSGMECARVLGERGYEAHLCEAEKEMGGHVREVMRYPGLAEWGRVITYRQIQLDKLKNVEVHTGTRLSADDVLKYGAGKVVLCTGAHWVGDGFSHVTMGPIPGANALLPQFATPEQVMAGKEVGDRVAVLDADGYFTGVGMAELMADRGKQVSIITHYGTVAPMTDYTLEAANLHRMMHEKNIRQYTAHWVEEVDTNNVVKVKVFNLYRDGYRRTTDPVAGQFPRLRGTEFETLEVDTVILVTDRRSNDGLYKDLKARKGEWETEGVKGVYQAGDCYAPRLMADAVFDGHRIARELDSPDPQKPLPYIRERMIWGQDSMPRLG